MYLNHYNLKAKPFEMTSDPRFIWMGKKQKQALAGFTRTVFQNKGALLLSGGVGAGKSAFVSCLLKGLANRTIFATIMDPALDVVDFLDTLAAEFKIKQRFVSHGDFLMYFNKFLHTANAKNISVILIIEEAQHLSPEILNLLKDLANIGDNGQKLINLIFVGQVEQSEGHDVLKAKLETALKQKMVIDFHLDFLTQEETQLLIQHRLEVAGGKIALIDPQAMEFIHGFSNGCPRLINSICDQALLTGYANGIKKIYKGVIKECAAKLGLEMKKS
jgi:general secretion pathway protein A